MALIITLSSVFILNRLDIDLLTVWPLWDVNSFPFDETLLNPIISLIEAAYVIIFSLITATLLEFIYLRYLRPAITILAFTLLFCAISNVHELITSQQSLEGVRAFFGGLLTIPTANTIFTCLGGAMLVTIISEIIIRRRERNMTIEEIEARSEQDSWFRRNFDLGFN